MFTYHVPLTDLDFALLLLWLGAVAGAVLFAGLAAAGGLGDVPGARSSHTRPTPTAGGLGIVAGLGLGLWVAAPALGMVPGLVDGLGVAASLVFAGALLGLQDDRFGVRARTRLLLVVALGLLAARALGPLSALPVVPGLVWDLAPWVAYGGTALWVVVVTNAVNFTDGINGYMATVCGAVAVVWAAVDYGTGGSASGSAGLALAVALSGALLGFLPLNFRQRARVFAGDVGALSVGLGVALLPLLQPGRDDPYLVAWLLLPMLADVFSTLLRRLRAGRPLGEAHREHLYQRMARRHGHLATSAGWALATVGMGLAYVGLEAVGWHQSLAVVVGVAALGLVVTSAMQRAYAGREASYERRATT